LDVKLERFQENRLAGFVLRWGLRISAAVMAAGLLLNLRDPAQGTWLSLVGVGLLVATPFVRVLSLAAVFARGRLWRLFWSSLAVWTLLWAAILLGRLKS
jgi:uncharacterized membrane protein